MSIYIYVCIVYKYTEMHGQQNIKIFPFVTAHYFKTWVVTEQHS